MRDNKAKLAIKSQKMTDRRRSDDHKQISGYVPVELAREFKSICARVGVSQSDALEEILREWITKRTASHPSTLEQVPRRTIADLVRANMTKLKRCGVKNLPALARGEVLPTPGDFAIITSTLGMPEEERQMIWQQTFRQFLDQDYGGIKEHECQCCKNPEPTGVEL